MGQTVLKRYDLQVTVERGKVQATFNLDKDIKFINGLLMSTDREDLMYYRGSQKIEINGKEIFPEGYESKLLMSGLNITPKQRFYDMGELPTGNGIIKLSFQDNDSLVAGFGPYRASLYLLGELDQ